MKNSKLYLSDFIKLMEESYLELEDLLENNLEEPNSMTKEKALKFMKSTKKYFNNYAIVVREKRKEAYAREENQKGKNLLMLFKNNLFCYRCIQQEYNQKDFVSLWNDVFELINLPTGFNLSLPIKQTKT